METKVTRIKIDLLKKIAEKNLTANEFIELALKEPEGVSGCVGSPTEKTIPTPPTCPECKGTKHQKNGFQSKRSGVYQKYLCIGCGRRWVGEFLHGYPTLEGKTE